MRSVMALESDLSAAARIREAAMWLFARDGVAATSIRAVAAEADVSPGLVIHYFRSKDGLCQAVDEWVVERFLLAMSEVPSDSPRDELVLQRADQVRAMLQAHPTLCNYLARALTEGSEASAALFHRIFAAARADRELKDARVVRADADDFWRPMQQVMLILGPLILRPLVERELGGALLEEKNLRRWMDANCDLLRNGIYA